MNIESAASDPIANKEAQLRSKIAKLQAQQRRQRLIEDLETPRRKRSGGFRFIHAFLIVLGLHVAAVGGFFGVSALRKMHASDKMALTEKAPVYVGVPDPSPNPAATSSTQSPKAMEGSKAKLSAMHSKKKKQESSVATSSPVKDSPPAIETPKKETDPVQQSVQKITPAIKALFTHHPTSAVTPSSHPSTERQSSSGAADALATMGNRDSEDAVPSPVVAPPHPLPPNPSSYTVGPGDTLSKVASMMGMSAAKIIAANGMESGSSLRVGQKLTIPDSDKNPPPLQLVEKEPESPPKKSEPPETFIPKLERIAPNGVYTVQRGDNSYSIAHRLGVSFTDLMTANNITNPADVTIGMHLKVPSGALASN
jgi:LysM repeat protein